MCIHKKSTSIWFGNSIIETLSHTHTHTNLFKMKEKNPTHWMKKRENEDKKDRNVSIFGIIEPISRESPHKFVAMEIPDAGDLMGEWRSRARSSSE